MGRPGDTYVRALVGQGDGEAWRPGERALHGIYCKPGGRELNWRQPRCGGFGGSELVVAARLFGRRGAHALGGKLNRRFGQ